MIYAVHILNGEFIKIGYAKNVEKRLKSMQCGSPFKIERILEVEGSLNDELWLHQSMRNAFKGGGGLIPPNEWYPGVHHQLTIDILFHLKESVKDALIFLSERDYTVCFSPKERRYRDKKPHGMPEPREPQLHLGWPRVVLKRKKRVIEKHQNILRLLAN